MDFLENEVQHSDENVLIQESEEQENNTVYTENESFTNQKKKKIILSIITCAVIVLLAVLFLLINSSSNKKAAEQTAIQHMQSFYTRWENSMREDYYSVVFHYGEPIILETQVSGSIYTVKGSTIGTIILDISSSHIWQSDFVIILEKTGKTFEVVDEQIDDLIILQSEQW